MTDLTFSCGKCEKDCSITDLAILLCDNCFKRKVRCSDCKVTGEDICCKCKKLNTKYKK